MIKDRLYYSNIIVNKIEENREIIIKNIELQVKKGSNFIFFTIDNLLPVEDVMEIYSKFPKKEEMREKKNLREYKLIEAQLNNHDRILEEITYSFQEKKVINSIASIIGKDDIIADEFLYAGGLSRMEEGNYLNPHLDNSHDKDRSLYRVLNLLYYITPNREIEDGGNLELWDKGLKNDQTVIHSKFNRLAIMVTNKESWHGVSKVKKGNRCCVSNYYFSKKPMSTDDYFHVTSFRGFPDQKIKDIILQGDTILRTSIRKLFPKGIVKNNHIYKK
ncbi:putative proline hydroxylase [Arcobacter venerupis]|uniref:Proline hydroxylase n=1 Tax=Arcobacter venerupis TaxID=1054033 RepID=A0AAE7B8R3_9BACT|nr:2OG-Fe(II) oxygenase [Arcobacter venerupis]QKF67528.1 putative proline hydroxylase [Arcobacter venerupis]RWS50463.1 2OG-Fe(II) oxygenase [Arcobacter venerupis]